MSDHPFRDDRDALLARIEALEQEKPPHERRFLLVKVESCVSRTRLETVELTKRC